MIKLTKIGRACWFQHPDGKVIEGRYQRGRRVVSMTGLTNHVVSADGSRSFDIHETIYTVPRTIRIHFGAAPIAKHTDTRN